MPLKPFIQVSADIIDRKTTFVLKDIPYGYYAAIMFHDENDNGELDHGILFPKEPLGFSNGWKLSLFSGMPTFAKLKFEYTHIQGLNAPPSLRTSAGVL